MRHFNYVRFSDFEPLNPNQHSVAVGCACILNGREICKIVRVVSRPPLHLGLHLSHLEAEAEAIEGEVRDTVDRMDPEVLL